MKIGIDIAGASPLRPDFDLLRASFVSVQAATATAQASALARRQVTTAQPLVALMIGDPGHHGAVAALAGSFLPHADVAPMPEDKG